MLKTLLAGFVCIASVAGAQPVAHATPFSVQGRFVEACSCASTCAAEVSGDAPGCDGVAACQIEMGTFGDKDISGIKVAAAVYAKDQVRLYVDAPAEQKAAAAAFARAVFGPWGKVQAVSEAKIGVEGKDGAYQVSVGGGKILSFSTEPVLGGDHKSPVLIQNTQNALNPTFQQGRCLGGTFSDAGQSFTIPKGRNAFFNPAMKAEGKL